MVYSYVIAGVAISLLLVTTRDLPTKEESCANTPNGSIVVLLDCPARSK